MLIQLLFLKNILWIQVFDAISLKSFINFEKVKIEEIIVSIPLKKMRTEVYYVSDK